MINYLKVLAATTVVLAIMLFMGACNDGDGTAPTPAPEAEKGGVELLSGYPEDILPLYKSVKIDSITFSVRGDGNYVFGKDIYTVNYLSSASAQDVIEYYRGITTSINEEFSTDDSLEGSIGENPIGVDLYEGDNGLEVSLIIGMKPSEYVMENPYFSDYPGDLIEPFGRVTFLGQSYEVREMDGTETIYTESYLTNVTKEEFQSFYSGKYDGAENLNIQDDEYGLTYQWDSRGFTCRASISANGGPTAESVTTIANIKK